jgi:hypothetical protein
MTTVIKNKEESEAPGHVPAGTAGAGRAPRRVTNERRQTVKAKKAQGGARKTRKRTARKNPAKPAGRNVPGGVTEAARILTAWGYIVGRVTDPDCPIHLIAHKGREMLSVTVVRPREPVRNASDVRYYHSREVLELQPYWNSDADNIQFWLFSRAVGLLRYRVFRGGIWNVETMQNGWQEKRAAMADQESANEEVAVQKSRTAPFPVRATGHE